MTSRAIITLALSLGGTPQEARLLDALAMQESSRAAKGVHVRGDGGKAWGIWQFHQARWRECGGDPKRWGKADAKAQAKVMLTAARKYTRKSRWGKLTPEQTVIVIGRYHNVGHCRRSERDKHNAYTRSLWKYWLKTAPKKPQAESISKARNFRHSPGWTTIPISRAARSSIFTHFAPSC